MKIIVSHDIDHLTAWEHKNMIIPKQMVRSSIELVTLKLTFKEYLLRFKELYINKWNNIEELIAFNKEHNIPATFFMGMSNGLGLDYDIKSARKWIKFIEEKGFDIGVHGIEYQDLSIMQEEYNRMKNILNHENFGIRMHYLRNNKETIVNLSRCGYIFDSTLYGDVNPYKFNEMYEFPLHIMDGDIMYADGKKWMSKTFEELQEMTKDRIDSLFSKKINYLTFLFHDRYFTNSFQVWKEWYIWSILYFEELGCEFISYKDAIRELSK